MKNRKPYCLLLTGKPNSGKSTIAYELVQKHLRSCLIIDGDKHREMQFLGETLGFSEEDILKNNEHVIKLAKFAQDQGINVIISQIAPYKSQRLNMRKDLVNFYEIFLDCSDEARANRPNFKSSELKYEIGDADLVLDTDAESCAICADKILKDMKQEGMI